MKIIDVEQGSPEWLKARLGIPTASNFDQIVTPVEGNLSTSSRKYLAQLVGEWFLGESLDTEATPFMERGNQLESEAAAWYEFQYDTELTAVGFCTLDDGSAGCSPDRLVGDAEALENGAVEIKCPGLTTQIQYLLNGPPEKYRCQVQGQLWILERDWVDLCCWHPTLPKVVHRSYRDESFIDLLSDAVLEFCDHLDAAKAMLADAKAAYDASKPVEEIPPELIGLHD